MIGASIGGRQLVLAALAVAFFVAGAWFWISGDAWTGGFVIAAGIAYPLSRVLAGSSLRGRILGFPSAALQPALLVVLGLTLSFCEFTGIGVRQDVGGGVVSLVGSLFIAYGVLLFARAFRSRD